MAAAIVTTRDWLAEFPPHRSLPLDQEAQRVYEHAYHIGVAIEGSSDPPITFSTVALALLVGQDETCKWFKARAKDLGPKQSAILSERPVPLTPPSPGRPAQVRLSSDKQLLTASARSVLLTAEEWATLVDGSDIGVRHLVAAYVINPPPAHRRDVKNWGVDEQSWRAEFFAEMASRYTAEKWLDVSLKVTPTKAVAAFEQVEIKGEDLDFPGDDAVQAVLIRAAEYHTRRKDRWLPFRTVLVALVDQVRAVPELQAAVAPVWTAFQPINGRYQQAFQSYLRDTAGQMAPRSFNELDLSPRVLNSLETARGLAQAASNPAGKVSVLNLAAAMVSRRVDGDEDWTALGFDPQGLRLAIIQHAGTLGGSTDVWRDAVGEDDAVTVGRSVDLNSDDPEAVVRADLKWTSDPLRIRPDVASFAALLASQSLEPPLAIGLFGPWGSGKTTFLKRLRWAIDDHATAARNCAPGTPSRFVRNVAHVEFNAWHFAEDALISSLVNTVAHELRTFIKDDKSPIGQALADIKSETAEAARGRVAEARKKETKAREDLSAAANTLTECEEQARKAAGSLNGALQAAWTATLQALRNSPAVRDSGLLDSLAGTVANVEELQQRVAAVRNRSTGLLGSLGWPITIAFAVAVLVVPLLVVWGLKQVFQINQVEQALASAGALLGALMLWFQRASDAAGKVNQALDEVAKAYEEQIRKDPKVQAATTQLATATTAAATAAKSVAAAQRELENAEAEAAAAAVPSQVLSLVSGRVDDRTYARELTSISTARADLKRLSDLIRDQAKNTAPAPDGVRPVDRVILYIDDLDRCRPQDVVRVLQVVHMLLAFELFVVVVAVDARWVEESLRQSYHWLAKSRGKRKRDTGPEPAPSPVPPGQAPKPNPLVPPLAPPVPQAEAESSTRAGPALENGDVDATPQDYLEKIFQISFWLEPMNATQAAEYLKSLVRTPRVDSGGAPSESESTGIDIQPIELDYLRALAAHVGNSPRRVKRLINAYRLLKARLSDTQLKSFVTDRGTEESGLRSGPYQLVIGLLVIVTGAPGSAAPILRDLADRDPGATPTSVIDAFRQKRHPDWAMAAQVLETVMRTQKAANLAELRGWARRVGRFLLQGPADVVGDEAR